MHHAKQHLTNLALSRVIFLALFVVFALSAAPSLQAIEASAENAPVKTHKWALSFGGVFMSGRCTPALLPESEQYSNSMIQIQSPYGFGLSIDYNLNPRMRLFFDGNFYTYRRQVGAVGEYSTSFWVYEMTDYESFLIGPFEEDAYYYMQTTGMRLGVKYGWQKNGFRPWVGAGIGIYSWKADYMTADRSATWGSDKGTVAGPTFLAGVDFIMSRESKHPIMISFFGDFTSPVVNPVIENLFQDGWTWSDEGGAHVMGPYRFGMSIGFLY